MNPELLNSSFRFHGALINHPDGTEFNYKFMGEESNKALHDVWVSLSPPNPIEKSEVNAWLHGPLWGAYRIEEDGSIIAWCEKLPRRQFFEIRALFPSDHFAGATYDHTFIRSQVMEEEARLAEKSNQMRLEAKERKERREARWSMGKWIVGLIGLGGLFGWSRLKKKFGKKETLPPPVKVSPDIPEGTPPALADYLLHSKQVSGGGLIGTLLDLANRGILSLHEEQEEKKGLFGRHYKKTKYSWHLDRKLWDKERSRLMEYENSLIAFIFDDLAEGDNAIDIKTLQKKQSKFTKFFGKWKKEVAEVGKTKKWFDGQSYKGMYYSMAIGGCMMLLTIGAAIYFGPWAIILGICAFLIFLLSFTIMHRTKEGEMEARRWTALRRYLMKYHYRNDQSGAISRLDRYFVYGAVLGIGKKVYNELAGLIPADETQKYVPWYIYARGSQGFSPESFSTAFSSMMAATTSAMSTASGTGGGASAGGGAGAGGGGVGAG